MARKPPARALLDRLPRREREIVTVLFAAGISRDGGRDTVTAHQSAELVGGTRHAHPPRGQGSREGLMTVLLAQESWTTEELDALQTQIDRVRKEGSRS